MKKALSLILALILTFSMGTLAFAEDAVALTKEEAKARRTMLDALNLD